MLNQLNFLSTIMLKMDNFLLRGVTKQKRKKVKVRNDKQVKRRERSSQNKVYTVDKIIKMTRQILMT